MLNIIAIIPARSGSKRIPNKNIKHFNNYPLIYWSIKTAKQSKYITKVVVSTNCDNISRIAKNYGAEVCKRPEEISGDLSTDYEFLEHCLNYINDKVDLLVQLRPTYPNRKVSILDDCIEKIIKNKDASSLRTVCEIDKPVYKMYNISNNKLIPLFENVNGLEEPYNLPAQLLPKSYWHNGYIDIIRPETIINQKSVTGNNIHAYLMSEKEIYDIDTIEEWIMAEEKHKHDLSSQQELNHIQQF